MNMNGNVNPIDGNGRQSFKNHSPILAGNGISTGCRTVWDPSNLFNCPSSYKHAMVILNRPIHWKRNLLLNVWKKASVKATVDGGTDRWLTFLGSQGEDLLNGDNDNFIPDLITGDMDSVSPETLEKFRKLGANVIVTPDQNATDYTKALNQLGVHIKSKGIDLDGIYVFVETSGRLDHIIANINTLYKPDKLVGDVQIIQVSSDSMTWLLQPGVHRILIPEPLLRTNAWCALMPIGSQVTNLTTTGLKWNLDNAVLEFGGMVSTSNTYSGSPEVTVTTDTAILWSMDIEPLIDSQCESLLLL